MDEQSYITKIKNYCAYQERSHREVRNKLIELKVYGSALEECIMMLIEENYLNEERYACAIARGKFNYKHWGRNKIIQALKQQNISDYCIQKAMKEIHDDDYRRCIEQLCEKKMKELGRIENKFTKFNKLKNYLLQKGFEWEEMYEVVKNISAK